MFESLFDYYKATCKADLQKYGIWLVENCENQTFCSCNIFTFVIRDNEYKEFVSLLYIDTSKEIVLEQ